MHDALVELFRQRPSLAAELLAEPLGVELPAWREARLDAGDLTEVLPTEYRADAVVTLTGDDGRAALSVVVEVQLGRDPAKRWSWPVYVATLRARLRTPTVLLVVCADQQVAAWCATPIELGHPGLVLTPVVIGPERVPAVTDPSAATACPELAVLSALTYGADEKQDKILAALFAALDAVDEERAAWYADVVLAALPDAARRRLETLMLTRTYPYQSDFARRYFGQGKAEGKAEGRAEGRREGRAEGRLESGARALLTVLDVRGIQVSDEAYTRIANCGDLTQLERWLRRAVTVDRVDELFA